MCESLDQNTVKLKKALVESINKANEADKVIMKQTLDNLNIDLEGDIIDESAENDLVEEEPSCEWDPEAPEVALLTEDTDEEESEETEKSEESTEDKVEEATEETSEADDEDIEDTEKDTKEETEAETVGEIIDLLQEYDSDLPVEFEAVTPEGDAFPVDEIESFIDEDEGALVISAVGNDDSSDKTLVDVNGTDENDKSETDVAEEESTEAKDTDNEENDSNTDDSTLEEVELSYKEDDNNNSQSAGNNGDEEVIESLKEVIRQKEALENEVSELRKAKAVGDTKEYELQEKLNRYRTAFRTMSAEAAKVPELQ
jgi:hypothetical protein